MRQALHPRRQMHTGNLSLTASALNAVKYYQTRLKNPASLQVRTACITNKGDICLEVGGQNGAGGMTVFNIAYTSKGRWLDEGGFGDWGIHARGADSSGNCSPEAL
jgi:hypothetical protein